MSFILKQTKKKLAAGSDTVLLCGSRVERAAVRVRRDGDRKVLCCHVRDSISAPGCSPDLLGNFTCQKPLVTKPATFSGVVFFLGGGLRGLSLTPRHISEFKSEFKASSGGQSHRDPLTRLQLHHFSAEREPAGQNSVCWLNLLF